VLTISAKGDWRALSISDVDQSLRSLRINDSVQCLFKAQEIEHMDTTGAWVLSRFFHRLKKAKIPTTVMGLGDNMQKLIRLVQFYDKPVKPPEKQPNIIIRQLNSLGQYTYYIASRSLRLLSFLGQICWFVGKCISFPNRLRTASLFTFIDVTGFRALPIVGLVSFLVGIVLVYQGAYQLKRFSAEIYAIDLLAISMLREVGILLTAIVVAGRSGSSFTAQIGTMKLNQEIDAMHTFGISTVEALVVPRTLGLLITLPLLTFYSDIMGFLGGALMAVTSLDMNFMQYLHHVRMSVEPKHFMVGMIKAPVFAFVIAWIGCYEGLHVEGGAANVGQRTTQSVVESIFLVIIVNAAFSVFFTYIGV
jgi:phospholipid/cholesterol/gamma-HCH transport system permease protein